MANKTTNPAKPDEKPQYPKITERRLEQISFTMEENKVDAFIVTYIPNIRYLTNFSGSNAFLLVLPNELHFITDDRYEEQIKTELYNLPNLKTHIHRDVWKLIRDKKLLKDYPSLGFEADRIPYGKAVEIRNQIRPIKFKPATDGVEPFTIPKAPEELEFIKKSCDIAIKTYEKMLDFIKPGIPEIDLAIEIAYQSRKLGSEGDPFDIIVVSGERSSLVHGKPTDRKIRKNDIVVMDFGCKVNGFCSDITRTIAVGKVTKDQKEIYKLCFNAQRNAINIIRPSMNGKTVDAAARDMIKKAGYGEYFQHSLGHGIGIEPHEMPTITFRRDDQVVPEDSVLAIEPGIYLPGKFGIRVEDMCYVTKSDAKLLTSAPEEIVVI